MSLKNTVALGHVKDPVITRLNNKILTFAPAVKETERLEERKKKHETLCPCLAQNRGITCSPINLFAECLLTPFALLLCF